MPTTDHDRRSTEESEGPSLDDAPTTEPAANRGLSHVQRLITRANRYHVQHAASVDEFNRLTGGVCAGSPSGISYRLLRAWQAEHHLSVDGLCGETTLAAARTSAGVSAGGPAETTPAPSPATARGGAAEDATTAEDEPAPGPEIAAPSAKGGMTMAEATQIYLQGAGPLLAWALAAEGAEAAREETKVAEGLAATDGGKGKEKQATAPKKTDAGSGSAKKTQGAKDLVQTYGTVQEADKQRADVQVYWVDGLKKEGKKNTSEEVDNLDGKIDSGEIAMKQQGIPVHKKIAPLFTEIFEEIKAQGDWKNILERPWALNARQNRNNSTEWSIHSWGTAIDVNPTTNGNKGPDAGGDYDPSARQKKIATHFTSRGFEWLDEFDAMHFQFHNGGAPRITDEEIADIVADDGIKKDKDKHFAGTSRKSLASNLNTNLTRHRKALKKAEANLAKAQAAKKPPAAKKLAKLEKAVQAEQWWIGQIEHMLILLGVMQPKEEAGAGAVEPGAGAPPPATPTP